MPGRPSRTIRRVWLRTIRSARRFRVTILAAQEAATCAALSDQSTGSTAAPGLAGAATGNVASSAALSIGGRATREYGLHRSIYLRGWAARSVMGAAARRRAGPRRCVAANAAYVSVAAPRRRRACVRAAVLAGGPIGRSAPGLAYDEIVRVVVNATPPPPGNFQADLAALSSAPTVAASPTPAPKKRGINLGNIAGVLAGGGCGRRRRRGRRRPHLERDRELALGVAGRAVRGARRGSAGLPLAALDALRVLERLGARRGRHRPDLDDPQVRRRPGHSARPRGQDLRGLRPQHRADRGAGCCAAGAARSPAAGPIRPSRGRQW